jgi:hypothetical protein
VQWPVSYIGKISNSDMHCVLPFVHREFPFICAFRISSKFVTITMEIPGLKTTLFYPKLERIFICRNHLVLGI